MDTQIIKSQLQNHETTFTEEAEFRDEMIRFIDQNPDFDKRSNLKGHFTASALILSPDLKSVLLIHHKKLNRWLQPGGHLENSDENLLQSAQREVVEECGLSDFELFSEGIFDVDVHLIPEKKDIPAHYHYDVRFLFRSNNWDLIADLTEINHVKWWKLEELLLQGFEQSVHRMLLKIKNI